MQVERVREAARGRWHDILPALAPISSEVFDERKHFPCPKCGGTDRFRVISCEDGALLCNQCFKERNGDGFAALGWLLEVDFPSSVRKVAEHLGVPVGKEERNKRAEKFLEFGRWDPDLVDAWAELKGGVSTDAVDAFKGRLATLKHVSMGKVQVVALPILPPSGASDLPRGWVVFPRLAATFDHPDGPRKIMTTWKSDTGYIGTVGQVRDARVVWKTEGPSDALALWGAMTAEERDVHAIVTNPHGSGERPGAGHIGALTGKIVVIVADPDPSGREGALRWAKQIASAAAEVRIIEPETRGDLRDFLTVHKGTFARLRELARRAEVVEPVAADESGENLMAEDCPLRLALRFGDHVADRIRYYREDSFQWRSGRWVPMTRDDLRQLATLFIRDEFRRLCIERRAEQQNSDDGPIEMKKITARIVNDTVQNFHALVGVESSTDWDTEIEKGTDGVWRERSGQERRELVTFANGILDVGGALVGRHELEPHTPDLWSTRRLPYDYDPGAELGPYFSRFLETNCEGDADRISILQEWLGYCLVPWTDLQKSLVLEGEGRNGKSVYHAALEATIGEESVSHVRLEHLGERFALCGLVGKLVNATGEVSAMESVAEGVFRALAAGDAVTIEKKGRDAYSTKLPIRLLIAWNDRPRFHDATEATWRRLLLIRFTYQVPDRERIPGMDKPEFWARGAGAGELPGIFNWGLEGLRRLRARGKFTETEESSQLVHEFRLESNPAQEFLRDHFELSDDPVADHLKASEVFDQYKRYCDEANYRPLGRRKFYGEVRRVFGVEKSRTRATSTGRVYVFEGLRRVEFGETMEAVT